MSIIVQPVLHAQSMREIHFIRELQQPKRCLPTQYWQLFSWDFVCWNIPIGATFSANQSWRQSNYICHLSIHFLHTVCSFIPRILCCEAMVPTTATLWFQSTVFCPLWINKTELSFLYRWVNFISKILLFLVLYPHCLQTWMWLWKVCRSLLHRNRGVWSALIPYKYYILSYNLTLTQVFTAKKKKDISNFVLSLTTEYFYFSLFVRGGKWLCFCHTLWCYQAVSAECVSVSRCRNQPHHHTDRMVNTWKGSCRSLSKRHCLWNVCEICWTELIFLVA